MNRVWIDYGKVCIVPDWLKRLGDNWIAALRMGWVSSPDLGIARLSSGRGFVEGNNGDRAKNSGGEDGFDWNEKAEKA